MQEKEILKIAEKVKFWEEQDRINKELIPRVLKNHDLITQMSSNISKYTETIIKLEQKIDKLEKCNNMKKIDNKLPIVLSCIALILSIINILV
ncbi:MAG: hypothetical protein RSG52_04915 [Terrisporobacter sp.]|uniref:hypothetical protein n=1 Tax=Terrisporobacter sp. TaxID=1965305 RepID=UPI002FC76831